MILSNFCIIANIVQKALIKIIGDNTKSYIKQICLLQLVSPHPLGVCLKYDKVHFPMQNPLLECSYAVQTKPCIKRSIVKDLSSMQLALYQIIRLNLAER